MLVSSRQQLKNLNVKESKDYALGLNSRVNQYDEQHLLMLDFDDVSTLPYHKLEGEPGFFLTKYQSWSNHSQIMALMRF